LDLSAILQNVDGHGPHHQRHHHDHDQPASAWQGLTHRFRRHSHDSSDKIDDALETSRAGIRALWMSLLVLTLTGVLQAAVVILSGSVALLADTIHNFADALTALPLGLAFLVGRRPATRRYTYGYGRAEDLAGLAVVLVIAASSALAGYESVRRLAHPARVTHLGVVAAAAVIGFAGNELVARYRINVGRQIGSAALLADGLHARTDGFTSLAVLLGAGGVVVGWRWADPVVGLLITIAIVFVLREAAREVYRRLMDAVDPALVTQVEGSLQATPGVQRVELVRLRWIGHRLHAEAEIELDPALTLVAAHTIAVEAEHRLLHDVPRLRGALIHPDPQSTGAVDHHALTAHHNTSAGPAPADLRD
jgi:cation diffusion facilitator family transporter